MVASSLRLDALVTRLRALGGVVASARLQREGFSVGTVGAAVRAGAVLRIRRRWLALPGADPFLVAAARSGVVLTCSTAAHRLGLWVLERCLPTEQALAVWDSALNTKLVTLDEMRRYRLTGRARAARRGRPISGTTRC